MSNSLPEVRPVVVELFNGQPTTTSLDVAEHFERNHKDVLRSIAKLDCSPEFVGRNFALSDYVDVSGRRLPMYRMTRDGFMFLCMGFTGPSAARWKEAYIEAFNRLERSVIAAAAPALADHELNKLAWEICHNLWPEVRRALAEAACSPGADGLVRVLAGRDYNGAVFARALGPKDVLLPGAQVQAAAEALTLLRAAEGALLEGLKPASIELVAANGPFPMQGGPRR